MVESWGSASKDRQKFEDQFGLLVINMGDTSCAQARLMNRNTL